MNYGYYDIHAHILPGLDDGPATMEETIALARAFVLDGASGVIATPKVTLGGDLVKFLALKEETLKATRRALHAADVALEVKPGAEIMIPDTGDSVLDFLSVKLNACELCLAETNFILVEYPEGPEPSRFETSLLHLKRMGFRPVIAHAERYVWLRNKQRLADLVEKGVYLQVCCDCLKGFFSPARRLMKGAAKRRLVHFIASEARDMANRRPRLGSLDPAGHFWQMENAKSVCKNRTRRFL